MPDYVTPGAPFHPRAADWNAFVATTRREQDSRSIFRPGPLLPGGNPEWKVVWITETGDADANKAFAATLAADTCICNTAEDGSGDEITVQLQSSPGVYFTMQRVIVIEVPDGSGGVTWEMLTAGTCVWVATAETDMTPDGDARLQYQIGTGGGTRTCVVPTIAFDPTFNVTAGTRVAVQFEQSTGIFYRKEAACPAIVEY